MRYPALISHQPRVMTVLVAQGSTVTPGVTKQLLPPDRVFKRIIYIYIYIYMPDQLRAEITLGIYLYFSVQFVILKKNTFTLGRRCY